VLVDILGTCCSTTTTDAAGVCCEGTVDACGVCDGDGTSCAIRATITYSVTSSEGLDTPGSAEYAAFTTSFAEDMSTSLGVDAAQITVQSVTAFSRHRHLLQTSVSVSFQVRSSSTSMSSTTVQAALDALVLDASSKVVNVASVGYAGICGNGACETGEKCSSRDDDSCCIADCPHIEVPCRVAYGAECANRGTCNPSNGFCSCFSGYDGEACDYCEAPWKNMVLGSGIEVLGTCMPAQDLSPPPSPPPPAPPPSPSPPVARYYIKDPQATSTDSTEVTEEAWFLATVGATSGFLLLTVCSFFVMYRRRLQKIDHLHQAGMGLGGAALADGLPPARPESEDEM